MTKETEDLPPVINKWDGQTVKNTLDDEIRRVLNDRVGWSECHSLMNGRLLISFIAVLFSGVAIVYDFLHPFPKSRIVLAICAVSYFILMGVLQIYQWYVERNTFYQAIESSGKDRRNWKWNSSMHIYDDKYTLSAEYWGEGRAGNASVTKSVGQFIDQDGQVVRPMLKCEVLALYKKLVDKDL